jgi:hypothetical protein
MNGIQLLLHPTSNNSRETLIWFVPNDDDLLPFPLNLHMKWRILIAISLMLNLIEGTRLRMKIFEYLKSPDANQGPINYLIWVDQINGTLPASTIISRILSLLLPFPVSSLLGEYFCNLVLYLSELYTGGCYLWGFCIALYRVIFVKAQNCLQKTIGGKNMLFLFLLAGFVDIFSFTSLLFFFDDAPTYRMCLWKSKDDTMIMLDFLVYKILTKILIFKLFATFMKLPITLIKIEEHQFLRANVQIIAGGSNFS